ncbi:olfactory receptor 14K1-like [Tachyglossus aculeatus]|uniref:olfactory receptor 14K1-like n=1 Tax=Tachyglossus aculeatus TaxID=9261 RepID=UPI0018F3987E|nr:olfactory receptor 14K1-like [Tachyglossus aculeatus]
MYTASTFSLSFCGPNTVHQFFCDGPQLLRLACSTDHVPEHVSLAISVCLVFICFVLLVGSYARIFSAVLRMPSAEGRSKAFSTCLPHLVVVTVFITSGFSAYLKQISDSSSALDLLVSVFYALVLKYHITMFFCDGPHLVRLACSTDHVLEDVSIAITICLSFFCFMLIVGSYFHIFLAVLRMTSAEGRSKSFSTCWPHLVVVTLYITSGAKVSSTESIC